ncbi:hypothetical protein [Streptomyces erythrochromogenes]|uniref:hypothetical protein n=1 Tax=Streptomyces erythrochromogenes TaxID=285574 RepID=UPI0033C9D334
MHMNPGAEPLPLGTKETAQANMAVFVEDVNAEASIVTSYEPAPSTDDGEGRFGFTLSLADGRVFDILMPGIPLERLRGDGTNAFAYHRVYVDGNSWLWGYAVAIVGEQPW